MPNQQPNQQVTRRQKRIVDPSAGLPNKPGRTHAGVECCRDCGAFHYHDRWYRRDKLPEDATDGDTEIHETLCPACRQIHDRNPGGVLTLTGDFLGAHFDEIMHLVHNEDHAAQGINPLEKIMTVERPSDSCVEITTTNEFLVQRLGKAINRAYGGEIEYKFGGSDCPVRVNWHRDAVPDPATHGRARA